MLENASNVIGRVTAIDTQGYGADFMLRAGIGYVESRCIALGLSRGQDCPRSVQEVALLVYTRGFSDLVKPLL